MSNADINQSSKLNGVDKEFITSFGSYIVLKFQEIADREKKNVYIHKSMAISKEDMDMLLSQFKNHRKITRNSNETYEAYVEDYGYISIEYDVKIPNQATIDIAIGFTEFDELIKPLGKNIKHEPLCSWVTGFNQSGEPITKHIQLKNVKEYHQEFYPSMNGESIEDFANRYLDSDSSILLLIGEPGTAKTNFVKQLLKASNQSILVTYSDDIKSQDSLFSHFYDCRENILLIEDADTFITKRSDGNSDMKQLLNITDGMTANPDKKVIFTTNLPSLESVDIALTRAGRCFKVIEFGKLSGQDLINANKIIGADINENGSYTIAELFGVKNGELEVDENTKEIIQEKKGHTIGFGC